MKAGFLMENSISAEERAQDRLIAATNGKIELRSRNWNNIALRKVITKPIEAQIGALGVVTLGLTTEPGRTNAVTKQGIWEGNKVSRHLHIVPADMDVNWQIPETIGGLVLTLNPKLFESILEDLKQPSSVEILPSFFTQDRYIERIMRQLQREIEENSLGANLFAESSAQLLALHLIRKHSIIKRRQELPSSRRLPVVNLSRAEEFMMAHIEQPISLNDLAKVAHLNVFYFVKSFRDWKGKTPYKYVMELRMERARQLLVTTKLPIQEIAQAIGFKNSTNFATAFREQVGISPLRYRKLRE